MGTITFECSRLVPAAVQEIFDSIADTARWSEFRGFGILPGIKNAEYEARTPEMVGSRIRVVSTDGSTHIEEITRWQPGERVSMTLGDFSRPLSRLATYFIEDWSFEPHAGQTLVSRQFQLYPSSPVTRPVLWIISLMFRKAVYRHLADMAAL